MTVSSEKRSCFFFTTNPLGLFGVAGFSLSLWVYTAAEDTPGGAASLVFQLTAMAFESFLDRNSTTRFKWLKLPVLEPSCPFRPQVCVSVPNRQAPKSSCWSMGILKGRLIEDVRWASQLCDLMAFLFCLRALWGRQNKMRVRLHFLKEI